MEDVVAPIIEIPLPYIVDETFKNDEELSGAKYQRGKFLNKNISLDKQVDKKI